MERGIWSLEHGAQLNRADIGQCRDGVYVLLYQVTGKVRASGPLGPGVDSPAWNLQNLSQPKLYSLLTFVGCLILALR